MSYGATDYFGLSNGSTVLVQSGEFSPSYSTDATVSDSNGDIRCRTKAGQTDEYSNEYKLCGGGDTNNDINIDTFAKVGDVVNSGALWLHVTSISVSTSNSEEPTLSITGIAEDSTTSHNTYSFGETVRAKKIAQTFGLVALDTGNYVTSGSIEISGNTSTVEDSQGDIVCREPYGYRLTASNTLQNCTSAPTATADTANSWNLENPIGLSSTNTDYESVSVEVFKDLTKD